MAPEFSTEVVDGSGTASGQISLAVDETNTPWIAYATTGGSVALARREKEGWIRQLLPSEPAARDAYRIGLAISSYPGLNPHVAYQSKATDHLIYGVRGTEWTFEEVPTRGGLFAGPVRFVSLRLNPGSAVLANKDTPDLAYQSGTSLWHAAKAPHSAGQPPRWKKNVHEVDQGGLVETGWFTAAAYTPYGLYRIAYFDNWAPAGQIWRRLRMARVAGGAGTDLSEQSQVELLHDGQILGSRPSMTFADSGEGLVSYYERNERAIRFCIFGDTLEEPPVTQVLSEGVEGEEEAYSACSIGEHLPICVVYGAGGQLMVAEGDGTTFTVGDIEAGGAWSDLVIDREGTVHVAHMNGSEVRYGAAAP
ncbi:hypothetical protein ABZ348_02770 [Streptomyces sp. NPDC005963]|uniref:hypothetical protein n=1 Tax=Streptomyces sp. NPDC005963 TaxID=3156721 RepID=UPI003410B20E